MVLMPWGQGWDGRISPVFGSSVLNWERHFPPRSLGNNDPEESIYHRPLLVSSLYLGLYSKLLSLLGATQDNNPDWTKGMGSLRHLHLYHQD